MLFTLVVLYVIGLLFFAIDRIVIKGKWEYVIFFMCLYLPFYIAILSIVYQATGSTAVVAVFQYLKELVLGLGMISLIAYHKDPFGHVLRLNIVDRLFLVFSGLATLYVFLPLGDASFLNKLIYLKNIFLMGILYFFGRNTIFNAGEIDRLFKFIMYIAIAAFCLNVLETVINTHFQQFTGYAAFNYAVNGMEPSGNYGLAWTFETQTMAKRLASFFSDPLDLASSCLMGFAVGLIWYLTTKREDASFYLLVMLATVGSLAFSSSRAAFASFFIMVFFIAIVFKLYRLLALGAGLFVFFCLFMVF